MDAVIISREQGRTYANLLRKKLKNKNSDNSEVKQNVRNISGTRDGDLAITTSAGGDSMVNLKKLLSKSGDQKARVSKRRQEENRDGVPRGTDAVATKEEVAEAVKKETGESPVRMGELRPYYGSYQAVTLRVTQELIKKRVIRIGLSLCGVTEKLEVTQCYRC